VHAVPAGHSGVPLVQVVLPGAVGRGNGNEKVYGSIPQGGSQVIDIFSKLLSIQFVVAARSYGRFGYPCRGVPSF